LGFILFLLKDDKYSMILISVVQPHVL